MNTLREVHAIFDQVRGVVRLTLREIFDEAAYARYLQRTGASVSRESYAKFLVEKDQTRAPAARCC
jgi:hypothetical protein